MMSKKSSGSIMIYSLSGSDLHFKPFVYEGQPIRTKTTKTGDNLKTRRAKPACFMKRINWRDVSKLDNKKNSRKYPLCLFSLANLKWVEEQQAGQHYKVVSKVHRCRLVLLYLQNWEEAVKYSICDGWKLLEVVRKWLRSQSKNIWESDFSWIELQWPYLF